jgi:acetyl esterase
MTPTDDHPLDPEIRAFVARTASFYPPSLASDDLAGQRAAYDAMARGFHAGRPAGVSACDERIAGVPVRRYAPGRPMAGVGARESGGAGGARPTLVYLHGGGFVLGGLDSHDDICAEICAATGLAVVSVDYRLAPEHPHPAQHDDALGVATALAAQTPILLVGDSAGGALAAAVAGALGRAGGVVGQALVYPPLARTRSGGSFARHANAPMLSAGDLEVYAALRFGGAAPMRDAAAFPLDAPSFAHLPPTVVLAAECDPLADDGPAYVAALTAAGVPARGAVEAGLVHGHLRARHMSAKACASFAGLIAAIITLARG